MPNPPLLLTAHYIKRQPLDKNGDSEIGVAKSPYMSYRNDMIFDVVLKPKAIKDLKAIRNEDASRVADPMERLQNNLSGDVKKLTNFIPAYRLRVGSYRVLFEIEENKRIVVYRVIHHREAYR